MSQVVVEINQIELADMIEVCYTAKRPLLIHGNPGGGKTAIVEQTAVRLTKKLGIDVGCLAGDLTSKESVDMRGMCDIVEDAVTKIRLTTWATPIDFPRPGSFWLWFFDELNRADAGTLKPCLSLMNERKHGLYIVPDGVSFVAACNDVDRGTSPLSSAMNSRMVHAYLKVELQPWLEWALDNGIHPLVYSYLVQRPEAFHNFNKDSVTQTNPRTWNFISDLQHQAPDPKIALALYAGTIGSAYAHEFAGFCNLVTRPPTVSAILLDPTGEDVPKEPSCLYAVSMALARHVAGDLSQAGKALQYLDRLPIEFKVAAVFEIKKLNPQFKSTNEFTAFGIKHQKVLL